MIDYLRFFFIPDEFRPGGACYGAGTSGAGGVLEATRDCVNGAIGYYVERLFDVVVIAAVAYIVYAGVTMATSFGNEQKYEVAKKTILYALIGLVIAILSRVIVSFIVNILGGDASGLTTS